MVYDDVHGANDQIEISTSNEGDIEEDNVETKIEEKPL